MEMQPFAKQNLSDAVKRMLYDYIDNLDLSKGTKLPSENIIAKNYGVSRVTIRRALDELEHEGIVQRIHGRGTFVNPLSKQFKINLAVSRELSDLIGESGYQIEIRLIAFLEMESDMIISNALKIEPGEPVYYIEKAYYADGCLAIVCQDYVAKSLFQTEPVFDDFNKKSTYEVLKAKAGKLVARDWMQLKTVLTSDLPIESHVRKEFECTSLLHFYGCVYDAGGAPLMYGKTYHNTDYIHFNLVRNIMEF